MRMLAVLLSLLLSFPALAQEAATPGVVRSAIEDFIRPGFSQLVEDAGMLQAEIADLCAAPAPAAFEAARAQFRATVTAWSRVELLRFGPLMTDNRIDRMLFWPDRKGIGLRQVQAILAEEDQSATRVESLREKSIAVQGLGALEFVLFGTGSGELAQPGSAFRCSYAAAIAGNLAEIGGALAAEWSDPVGISGRLLAPEDTDPQYRSDREVLEELIGVLAHGIEAITDTRLLPFLGRDGTEPRPKAALLWRSDMTVAAVRANFDGLADLFEASGIGKAMAAETLWVANGVAFEFANARRATDTITLPLEQALLDPQQHRALDYLVILTQSLQGLLGESLPAALGLSVGFSSLDGD